MRTWQLRYCMAEYETCARYQLALEAKPIPATLLPNGKHLPAKKG